MICQRELEAIGGSHMQRRPCMEGKDLKPEEWATLYENLRKLKACVASAKPCLPRKHEEAKEKAPPGKARVKSVY